MLEGVLSMSILVVAAASYIGSKKVKDRYRIEQQQSEPDFFDIKNYH